MRLISGDIITGESIVYCLGMIRSRLQEIARNRGIENAYQLEKLTGIPTGQAYRLWRDRWTQINFKTLNTLCNYLHCTPNELLEFTPDADLIFEI